MVEERGKVVAIESGAVWIEPEEQSGCHSCQAKASCSSSVLAQWYGKSIRHIRAISTDQSLSVGDHVLIGIPDHSLLTMSLVVYALPILLMLMTAGGVYSLGVSDLVVALGAALGLVIGMLLIRYIDRRIDGNLRYQPRVIRRDSDLIHRQDSTI